MQRGASVRKTTEPRGGGCQQGRSRAEATGPHLLFLKWAETTLGSMSLKQQHKNPSTPVLQTQRADLLQVGSKPPWRSQMYTQVQARPGAGAPGPWEPGGRTRTPSQKAALLSERAQRKQGSRKSFSNCQSRGLLSAGRAGVSHVVSLDQDHPRAC